MSRLKSRRGIAAVTASALAVAALGAGTMPASAAATVAVTPLGWNVVGLDSNKVTVGPNQFPVGARVCNDTGAAKMLTATWVWQSSNTNINVVGGAGATPEALPAFALADGACRDLYWTVDVTRSSAAYGTSRNFQINVSDGATTVSTPAGRQIFVERLVSQNRNVVAGVTGPGIAPDTTPLYTGRTYTYSVVGSTAPGGYEQLVLAAVFPPSIFDIVSVSTAYAADSSAIVPNPNDQVYGDGCGWNNTTRACTGTGKIGGAMTSTVTVRAIGAGTGVVLTEIYDFSGSSYHYNADFGASAPTVTVKQSVGSLAVVKTATPPTFSASGTSLTFTVTTTNTGNIPLTNVDVVDSLPLTLALSPGGGPCLAATLAVGASFACTGTYSTLATDVAAGAVTNTATATGTDPAGNSVAGSGAVRVPGPAPRAELAVLKSASPAAFTASGQTLTYTVTATNTGNLTLTSVQVTDPKLSSPLTCTWPALSGTLLAGQKATCAGTYTTTAADVAAGGVTNTATATGRDPGSNVVTDTGTVLVPGPTPSPQLSVVKSASPASFSAAGTSIGYTVTAANTGNVTLTSVSVSDDKVSSLSCSWPAATGTLTPGQSVTCAGSRLTTDADVAAGGVTNVASARGTPPSGTELVRTGTVTVPGPTPTPQLSVVKTSTPTSFSAVGTDLAFRVVVTNTGNVALTDVGVTDSLSASITGWSCTPGAAGVSLAVNAAITCTGTYRTTQADVDAGKVRNAATATGTPPTGSLSPTTTTIDVPGPTPNPGILLVKSVSPTKFGAVGDVLAYTLRVENTGNVTLTGVNVTDTKVDSPLTCGGTTLPVATFTAAATFTCTGSHRVTQADLDAGGVTNVAAATGTKPAGGTVTSQSSVLTPGPNGAISVVKTANRDSFTMAGQTVEFSVVATNVGNVTLTEVTVSDGLPGVTLSCSPGNPLASLAPLSSVTCTGSYVTTQSDVTTGSLENEATAAGRDPGNVAVTDTGSVVLPAEGASPSPTPEPTPTATVRPTPRPTPTATPTSSASPAPTASSTGTPTATPTASPTPTPRPTVQRIPQVPVSSLGLPSRLSPFGPSTVLESTVMTNAGQPAKVQVTCTIPRAARGLEPLMLSPTQPKGDVRLCKVTRGKDGKVSVTVLFPPPVKVTMTLSAPAKGKYGPYKQVISYTTRMKP